MISTTYIPRSISPRILESASFFPVIVITGPRQTGKTTLAKHLFPQHKYYNLESPLTRQAVESDPAAFIMEGEKLMIIDEIQRLPQLFSYIQVCVDEDPSRRFVITGSSDFQLMEKITQSLAGRAALFTLLPFSFKETQEYVDSEPTDPLLWRGLYPGVIVNGISPDLFYSNYYSTYVERDARQISTIENLDLFRLFIRVLAGRTATEFNANSLSSEIGVSGPTIRKWLGILKTSYIAFTLTPFHFNIEKRLTKTPKVYFYDTGLLCNLLGIYEASQLQTHPARGAVFENMAIVEKLKEKFNTQGHFDLYFYRERNGREVDLLLATPSAIDIYEIKSSATFNKAFASNLKHLKGLLGDRVKEARVVYDGPDIPPLALNIRRL
ncbi:MAG: ATP-binding protein [Muribaculaceae bacterium]|nr:ATP-binding protein [Muribaculaceae bacterium]